MRKIDILMELQRAANILDSIDHEMLKRDLPLLRERANQISNEISALLNCCKAIMSNPYSPPIGEDPVTPSFWQQDPNEQKEDVTVTWGNVERSS